MSAEQSSGYDVASFSGAYHQTPAASASMSESGSDDSPSQSFERLSCTPHADDVDRKQSVQTPSGDTATDSEGYPCAVCCDRGSGFHYGVYSCEGCKGFFKRTVQRNMMYVCKETGSCAVNKFTRNTCQHCRFRRCIDVGMKREAVREDRTPGGRPRVKKVRLDEGDVSSRSPLSPDDSSVLNEDELVLISQLLEARPDIVPEREEVFGEGSSCQSVELDVNGLMNFGYVELRLIINWSRKVPGFQTLLLDDQMSLLKSSFMELSILRLAFRSLDCDNTVRFANSLIMSPEQCVHIGWGIELVDSLLEFIVRLRQIGIDQTEFAILNAVILTYPDAAGITDRHTVITLQNHLLYCLQKYSSSRYPNTPYRYGKILLRLPALRTISAKVAEKFLSLSLEGDVKMNALVLEMMN